MQKNELVSYPVQKYEVKDLYFNQRVKIMKFLEESI